jgi:hypothetical protein
MTLIPANRRHFRVAERLLDMGLHSEAMDELREVEGVEHVHPDVLQLRFLVAAEAGWCNTCMMMARALARLAPDRFAWLSDTPRLQKPGPTAAELAEVKRCLERAQPTWRFAVALARYCYTLSYEAEAEICREMAFDRANDREVVARLRRLPLALGPYRRE